MYLPTLFVLAYSSLVTILLWAGLIVAFSLFKAKLKTAKSNTSNQKKPAPKEKHSLNNPDIYTATKKSVAPDSPVVGYDETIFSHDETDDSSSLSAHADKDNPSCPKIKLNSRDELKKAIIYHEILDRKY